MTYEEIKSRCDEATPDAEFIVHARTDIPLLLKALELVADRYADNDDKSCNWNEDYWLEEAARIEDDNSNNSDLPITWPDFPVAWKEITDTKE